MTSKSNLMINISNPTNHRPQDATDVNEVIETWEEDDEEMGNTSNTHTRSNNNNTTSSSSSSREHKKTLKCLERFHHRRRTQKDIGFVYTHAFGMVCVFVYMLAGFLFFEIDQGWEWYDSLYFAVSTFTTVGYGDLTPTTQRGRLFTIFYSLFGVILIGAIFSIVSEQIAQANLTLIDIVERRQQDQIFKKVESRRNFKTDQSGNKPEALYDTLEDQIPTVKDLFKSCFTYILALIIMWIMFYFQVNDRNGASKEGENYTTIDFTYFMISTMTTIGYGDISPQTKEARICAIIFIPILVFGMTSILAVFTSWRSRRIFLMRQVYKVNKGLRAQDLMSMDMDKSGQVSMLEFVEFMLLSMGRVDKSFLELIRKQFHEFDVDNNGFLDFNDLKAIVGEDDRRIIPDSFPSHSLRAFTDTGAILKL